jgi:hypothetical protein
MQESERIELEEDMYCYVFTKMVQDKYCRNFAIQMFKKCYFIFFLQVFLVACYFFDDSREDYQPPKLMQMGVRLGCAYILHLMIVPELRVALQMMKYLRRLPPASSEAAISDFNKTLCWTVAFMKYMSSFLCEIVNILIICSSASNQDIIKDFVCLGFIIEVDDLFAKAIIKQDELSSVGDVKLWI